MRDGTPFHRPRTGITRDAKAGWQLHQEPSFYK
jgi:hypothetical protein